MGGSYRNSGGYDYVSSDGKHAFIPAGAKVRIVKLEEPLLPKKIKEGEP